MFSGSTPTEPKGSRSSQNANNTSISFASLAIAAKRGVVGDVVSAIEDLETSYRSSIKNHKLVEYVAELQDDNQIFSATLCWIALLDIFIAEVNKGLHALVAEPIDGLRQQLLEHEKSLAEYLPQIQQHTAEIAAANQANAAEIQQSQTQLAAIKVALSATQIAEHEQIIDWEQRYTNAHVAVTQTPVLSYQNSSRIIDPVATLYRDTVGDTLDVVDVHQLKQALADIRTKLDALRTHIAPDALDKVAQRKILSQKIEKLQSADKKVELQRLQDQQGQTRAEIAKINSIIKPHDLAILIAEKIKKGELTDENFIEESFSTIVAHAQACKKNEGIAKSTQAAFGNIKNITYYLSKCSTDNNIRRFLPVDAKTSSLPNTSATYIRNILSVNDAASSITKSNLTRLEEQAMLGCIVAEIYLLPKSNGLVFEQLAQKGQELQSSC